MSESPGYSDVLIGLQYGDEGKAKIIDYLAGDYDIVARFNGGANAGHTVKTHVGSVALKQIPSGVFHPGKHLYIGSGCVINAIGLVEELESVKSIAPDIAGRLRISSLASLVQPHHLLLDKHWGSSIGSTLNGIGPAYADRALRMAGKHRLDIRLGEACRDPEKSVGIMQQNFERTCRLLELDYTKEPTFSSERLLSALHAVAPLVEYDRQHLCRKVATGDRVLFEGAQSYMLDVVKGTVPYVTSSSTQASAAYVGGDLPVKFHRKTIGVAKAIMSRVGNGPFPTELGGARSEEYCTQDWGGHSCRETESAFDVEKLLASADPVDVGMGLRIISGEYGTNTGRPRRIGYLDIVQLSSSIRENGVNELYLNKCDLLHWFSKTGLAKIPLVTSYGDAGNEIGDPSNSSVLFDATSRHRKTSVAPPQLVELPLSYPGFAQKIGSMCGCRVAGIGAGPSRMELVTFASSNED